MFIKQKEKKESISNTTQHEQSCREQNVCDNGPRTSTPVDQGKAENAVLDKEVTIPILLCVSTSNS